MEQAEGFQRAREDRVGRLPQVEPREVHHAFLRQNSTADGEQDEQEHEDKGQL